MKISYKGELKMENIIELHPKREKRLYRAKEVQEIFNVNRSTLNSWMHSGILTKYKKIGKLLYFNCDEVDKLAEVY